MLSIAPFFYVLAIIWNICVERYSKLVMSQWYVDKIATCFCLEQNDHSDLAQEWCNDVLYSEHISANN